MPAGAMSDKEIFDKLLRHESLRKLRMSFDFLFHHPVWWVTPRGAGHFKSFVRSFTACHDIWHDPRVRDVSVARQVFAELVKRQGQKQPYFFEAAGLLHYCIPLVHEDRVIGCVGLRGLQRGVRREALGLLAGQTQLILDNCLKTEEVTRLSATIRPRAVALSTVHTVHRIINSTLNLDELITRLAHLTAQVMRTNRCAIYLIEDLPRVVRAADGGESRKRRGPGMLLCKAHVGYPRNQSTHSERVCFGRGLVGKVARNAQTVLRKQMICLPLIDEDVIGVVHVSHRKDRKEFTHFDQEILTTLAEEAAIAIKNAQLYEEQKKVTLGTIQSLAVILGTHVPHLTSPEYILSLSLKIAREIRLSEEETQALHYATLLKDATKLGIPSQILTKPEKLTGEEYRLLRSHPIQGAKIVQSFESLRPVVPIILYSREKFDGSGYPKGLRGDRIPIGARILSVVTAFEAIILGRPYRNRASIQSAIDEITRNSGTQFDPKVVSAFLCVINRENPKTLLKKIKGL